MRKLLVGLAVAFGISGGSAFAFEVLPDVSSGWKSNVALVVADPAGIRVVCIWDFETQSVACGTPVSEPSLITLIRECGPMFGGTGWFLPGGCAERVCNSTNPPEFCKYVLPFVHGPTSGKLGAAMVPGAAQLLMLGD